MIFLFRPLKMGSNFVFGCVLVFATQSQYSTQNRNHTKAFSVVIRTILKNFEIFLQVSRKNRFEIF